MRDEHHEPRFGNLFEYIHDLDCVLRVEVARRFVRKDYIRSLYQRAGYRHPLLLSARKRVPLLVLVTLHIHDFQDFFAAALYFRFVLETGNEHRVSHDLRYCITAFKVIVLEDKAYLRVAYLIYLARDVLPVYDYLSAVLFFKSAEDIQKSCFSRTALTENSHESLVGKVEGNAFEYLVAVSRTGIERLFYVLYLDLDHTYFDPLLSDLRIDCPFKLLLNPNATNSTMSSIMISMKR